MFTPALLTTAKAWKQPKCPLTDRWIKKICYTYTMVHIYYGTHVHGTQWNTSQPLKRVKYRWPFAATWMEIIILSEVSQTKKDKYHMISLLVKSLF